MLDSTGYATLVAKRPYFYHAVYDPTEARLDSIRENGLEREQTHYEGVWKSRVGHVYMGEMRWIRRCIASCDEDGFGSTLRIETAKLDRRRISADEDHFLPQGFEKHNMVDGKPACYHFHRGFPPCKWLWEWTAYLRLLPLPSLGEWAASVNLGENPEETRYSITKGSISYEGVVPPSALSVVSSSASSLGSSPA